MRVFCVFYGGKMENLNEKDHKLEIICRKKVNITGVNEVISSQDSSVSIKTNCGAMQICGSALRIGRLDLEKGILEIEGSVTSVKYVGSAEKKSFFARIFK